MESVTLLVAVTAGILILFLPVIDGFTVYMAVVAWYPSYLTVKVGTADFTVARIVVLVVLLNLWLRGLLSGRLKFIWLDKLMIIYFLCQLVAGVTTTPISTLLENRCGAFFDMVLPYFAVRLTITTRKQYHTILKAILVIAAPLALFGIYECLTGNNPFGFLKNYHAWNVAAQGYGQSPRETRFGFYRAIVTFPQPIIFGLFFAMLGPIGFGILHVVRGSKLFWWICIVLMVLGSLASVSSGPVLSFLLAIFFIVCYPLRKYWKAAVILVLFMIVSVEILSNRHFYDVIDRFTFSSGTAWYRSKLMEVALGGGMSGHWLTGFGFTDPGWSLKIDGRDHTDIVNNYLLILARYGLVGFLPFICILVATVKKLVHAFKLARLESDRWMIWSLSGALFGLFIAFFSVSLAAQTVTFFSILLGLCGAIETVVSEPNLHPELAVRYEMPASEFLRPSQRKSCVRVH